MDVLALIEADAGLGALLAEAGAQGGDEAHDVAHALRVARLTLQIGGDEVDEREAIAAALLHDAVTVPKDSPDRARASERSAELATSRLPAAGFSAPAVARIAAAIRDHAFSRGRVPEEALGRALQDADRLEALGAIGLLRCLATGFRMGARWFDAADPWARGRPLDDRRYSVDHFFTKLLRLPAAMCTEAGRAEAERRAALLRAFLVELGAELGCGEPPGSRLDMS